MSDAPPLAFGSLDPVERPLAVREWWREVARAALFSGDTVPAGFPFEQFFDRAYRWFAGAPAWRVPSDVRPSLRALRRSNIRLAVFSNWDHRLIDLLESHGLRGYFSRVIVSSDLISAKPSPRAFVEVEQQLVDYSRTPPVMVGDRIDHDVLPAMEAGWDAIWLARADRDGSVDPGAKTVSDLRQLIDFI